MNTRQRLASVVIATVAAFAGTAAVAQEATSDAWMTSPSTTTRAQVQAELQQARADGSIRFARAGYIETLKVSTSRDAVKADTLAARRSGELQHINGEVYGFEPVLSPVLARAAR
jgi:hypothetical protein